MKLRASGLAVYNDEGGVAIPQNDAAVDEIYEEMMMVVTSLCANPNVVNLADVDDDLCHQIVQLAHSIVHSSKTMQLAMLEEKEKRQNEESIPVAGI
tara:strand:+ start:368 stop:658 length:291 start_codon:yes stop_codon:yes gene_type:complete